MPEDIRRFYIPKHLRISNENYIDLNTIALDAIREAEADHPKATKEEQIRVVLGAISTALASNDLKPHKSIKNNGELQR